MRCKTCNKLLPEDSDFCQYCGGEIEKNSEEKSERFKENSDIKTINTRKIKKTVKKKEKHCSYCDGIVDMKTKICTQCGKKKSRIIEFNKTILFKLIIFVLLLTIIFTNIFLVVKLASIESKTVEIENKIDKLAEEIDDIKDITDDVEWDVGKIKNMVEDLYWY